jgi:hypothetical protein
VLQEVEKEVVLLDQNAEEQPSEPVSLEKDSSERAQDADASTNMVVDAAAPQPVVDCPQANPSTNGHRVLKIIRKVEVQVLCTQHNPVCRHMMLTFGFELIYFTIIGGGSHQES